MAGEREDSGRRSLQVPGNQGNAQTPLVLRRGARPIRVVQRQTPGGWQPASLRRTVHRGGLAVVVVAVVGVDVDVEVDGRGEGREGRVTCQGGAWPPTLQKLVVSHFHVQAGTEGNEAIEARCSPERRLAGKNVGQVFGSGALTAGHAACNEKTSALFLSLGGDENSALPALTLSLQNVVTSQ